MRLRSQVISSATPNATQGVKIATIRPAGEPKAGSWRIPRAMKKLPNEFVKMTSRAKSGVFHFHRVVECGPDAIDFTGSGAFLCLAQSFGFLIGHVDLPLGAQAQELLGF